MIRSLNPLDGYFNKVKVFDELIRFRLQEEARIKQEIANPASYTDFELMEDFESTLLDGLNEEIENDRSED
jgi:hypothetical protein